MKTISLISIYLIQLGILADEFSISPSIYNNQSEAFIAHNGDGKFGSYLAMNINYLPIKRLHSQLQKKFKIKLKTRGESHITTVTPPEYYQVLRKKISINDINSIAIDLNIQQAKFTIICLGRGKRGNFQTFYLVVKSLDLLKIRKKIKELFIARGGDPQTFTPNNFHPHITIAFTKRDLHEADGIIKNELSCLTPVTINQ